MVAGGECQESTGEENRKSCVKLHFSVHVDRVLADPRFCLTHSPPHIWSMKVGAQDRQGQLGDGFGTQMEEEPGVACLGEKWIVGGRQSDERAPESSVGICDFFSLDFFRFTI